ncbi:hypothetical protein J437_LFUL013938 [Ladona fulva]|uniref:Uncharacterized protein n=1 Tax=Ladona fulva TaxID=123851 RepID=A0A8K0KIF9_LADFU|nr:hypothetical protein J437_LFUL013938 [Ladona fulva]
MYFGSKSVLPRFVLFKWMKAYEKIDKSIAKASLQKISQHLWYLTDEVSLLSLFDDDVDQETKQSSFDRLKLMTVLSTNVLLCGQVILRFNAEGSEQYS